MFDSSFLMRHIFILARYWLGSSLRTSWEKQAQEHEDARTGLAKVNPQLRRLYEGAWGPFVVGDYRIGETVAAPGTSSEVVWSYQTEKGLVYVIDENSGRPVGVLASQVVSKVTP